MTKTSIQWTDFSVNPFKFRNLETGKVGHHCTKISDGCKLCYASKLNGGPYLSGLTYIAENKAKGEFFLDEAVLQKVLKRKKPARIFWLDMTDMFLEDYPDEWIDRCFAVMALTPQHTHQVLTKRAKRMREYFTAAIPLSSREEYVAAQAAHTGKIVWDARGSERRNYFGCARPGDVSNRRVWPGWPLPHVHLGVSVEDQPNADARIPELLATPARVRWASYEPALAAVDFRPFMPRLFSERGRIDWLVVGGESGSNARPCDLAWLRSAVAQCRAAGVPVFVKQLGADPREGNANGNCRDLNCTHPDCGYIRHKLKDRKGGEPDEWPADLRVRELPEVRA